MKSRIKFRVDRPINVVVVGGGTNPYWTAVDFSRVASASVDKRR